MIKYPRITEYYAPYQVMKYEGNQIQKLYTVSEITNKLCLILQLLHRIAHTNSRKMLIKTYLHRICLKIDSMFRSPVCLFAPVEDDVNQLELTSPL